MPASICFPAYLVLCIFPFLYEISFLDMEAPNLSLFFFFFFLFFYIFLFVTSSFSSNLLFVIGIKK